MYLADRGEPKASARFAQLQERPGRAGRAGGLARLLERLGPAKDVEQVPGGRLEPDSFDRR